MFKKRSLSVVLITSLMILQLACGGLLSERSGGGGATASGRPAPHFSPGFNLFSPEQDVELGKQSAQQIARQVPLLRDERVVGYIRQLGAKLAAKAPGHKFPYQFEVVATKDVDAFALPGGYIFINAGTIATAKNEGELAGVRAHEITLVARRHGPNQATKAYIAQAGLGILGAIAGRGDHPDLGQVVETIGGAGANMIFLKFGRTAETQADLEGARIMAESGYDPRDMANFFKTLQSQGGQRVPEFLSDHPDPGNRVAAINDALPSLPLSAKPTRTSNEFEQVKALLTGGRSAQALRSSSEPERVGPRDPGNIEPGARPAPPSATFSEFQARDGSFAFRYPQNWDALSADESNMIFAPEGAYGEKEQSVFVTHGIFIGVLPPPSSDLRAATEALVQQQVDVNPDFRVIRAPQPINFNGRAGFATAVAGPSAVTGVIEVDVIYTTATADGRLFYLITMAPEDEFKNYQATFEQIINSLRLAG